MPEHARRATRTRMQARSRAGYLAERIGRSLRDARTGSGLLQREVAERAGVSQSFYSRIELGRGSRATLETLAACAQACDAQLAAFVEALPGARLPRDIEHVRRQQAVITLAAQGRWQAMPERPIDLQRSAFAFGGRPARASGCPRDRGRRDRGLDHGRRCHLPWARRQGQCSPARGGRRVDGCRLAGRPRHGPEQEPCPRPAVGHRSALPG